MTSAVSIGVQSGSVADVNNAIQVRWPLAYCLQPPNIKQPLLQTYGFDSNRPIPLRWWSHRLYRGPGNKEVEILYSRTKAQSEIVAQHFLNEPVLGFDMEWPWNDWKRSDLQNKVGLIQIASESKVGLFHIGLHPGKTTDDIIAPTLRQLLEDPAIGKVGVNILKADFARLHRFFGLNPKGAIESSHLHRLVKFGARKPELVSVKLVSLAHQVEDQLGLPLYKGDVRTSNWSKPLSKDQINYAAGDAYAGFMLYHCMNAQRLAMNPSPPLPIYAEKYPKGKASKDDPILLDAGNGSIITSEEFFGVKAAKSAYSGNKAESRQKVQVPKPSETREHLDRVSQALYDDLVMRRATLAENAKVQASRILSDSLLESLARERPLDVESLLSIKGIGRVQQQKYGHAWLEVISLFLATNGMSQPVAALNASSVEAPTNALEQVVMELPRTPRHGKARRQNAQRHSTTSSPAFESPPPRTPQLPTGLSFTLAETNLDAKDTGADEDEQTYDSDDSLPSLDFGSPSRRTSSQLKRKRSKSPARENEGPTVSPHLALCTETCQDEPSDLLPGMKTAVDKEPLHYTSTTRSNVEPLTPRSSISRNKLMAFSKLVTSQLAKRPPSAPPIVTDHTLDLIIRTRPRTQEDLEKIPGIDSFLLACHQTDTDLLRNIIKFAPAGT
ncbi:ribonuclease H-like domain-containing protein [Pyrenochaeta sp. MPI-SDFR-AT-0127]|nr:ribonuclease H-like domain-containing protein [Pyrenochaeta sp. MPI-SDFR-AT-0127]